MIIKAFGAPKKRLRPRIRSKMAAGRRLTALNDKATMREFDVLRLAPVEPFTPQEIRSLREREQFSQPVSASYMNIQEDAVSKWERGEKRLDVPSLQLLNRVKDKGLEAIA